ncbi:MAG: hypothetical protein CVU38_21300 [Chloroflexi bacterium HGW-Chloroflexi-1]|nr:MAG: hypothetical protein CVU38_21300 [Chloroflexi bacterium HGW-Chloroflexi-1]
MSKPNEVAVQRRWDWRYPVVARGEGIYLWDTDGKRYIDGSGGSSVVTSIGHGVKDIPEAMYRQAQDYSFYPAHAFSNPRLLELADLLAGLAPGALRNNCKVWMTVTGSEATDDAARLARQYWVVKGKPSKHIIIATCPKSRPASATAATSRRPTRPATCSAPARSKTRSARRGQKTSPPLSRSRWSVRPWPRARPRTAISRSSVRSATAMICCSSPTR